MAIDPPASGGEKVKSLARGVVVLRMQQPLDPCNLLPVQGRDRESHFLGTDLVGYSCLLRLDSPLNVKDRHGQSIKDFNIVLAGFPYGKQFIQVLFEAHQPL